MKYKYVSGSNYFNEDAFNEMVSMLEAGQPIMVGISCIGHTHNNMEQEVYREALVKKFGDKLIVKKSEGVCSYHYNYELQKSKKLKKVRL